MERDVFFENYNQGCCVLCGDASKPTGEHKIKASLLEREVGGERLFVGRFGVPGERMRLAQSVNSKHLKFEARLCEPCNTARTQSADRAFDKLHEQARALVSNGRDPSEVVLGPDFADGRPDFLNAFRYLAKLLLCHLAEVGAPRHTALARFALSLNDRNRVFLHIGLDPTFSRLSAELGVTQYAAHGGLVVYGDRATGAPNAFHSMLTLGPIQYTFWTRLKVWEQVQLALFHQTFYGFCEEEARKALENPIGEQDRERLGL